MGSILAEPILAAQEAYWRERLRVAALEAAEQEIEQAKDYLVRLLKAVYPDIDPLPSLLGLISQVDNGFAVPLIEAQRGV